ncbi:MAG: peptidoglycan editing factor PgeF [Chloroflexota bacterium]|nr:MAG: laccase domain protein [Bellilinea sp.]
MPFVEINGLEYYRFDLLGNEVIQAVFTRKGGVSPQPWASLNLGGTVGDSRENVIENRRRIFDALGIEVESIFDVWQVHSDKILLSEKPRPLDHPHEKADAIVTNNPSITLFMRFADCVPILLFDPVHQVIGLIHAGWKGTVQKIAAKTVQFMAQQFNSSPADILAGIGPSIGVDHYIIGDDVVQEVNKSFGSQGKIVLHPVNGSIHFDLWSANEILLREVGVKSIQVAQVCTACDLERWFSHRAEQGKTGRFAALIKLRKS